MARWTPGGRTKSRFSKLLGSEESSSSDPFSRSGVSKDVLDLEEGGKEKASLEDEEDSEDVSEERLDLDCEVPWRARRKASFCLWCSYCVSTALPNWRY